MNVEQSQQPANPSPTSASSADGGSGAAHVDTVSRVVTSVVQPASHRLAPTALWTDEENPKPNIPALTEHLPREGRLQKADVIRLVEMARAIFAAEPNVVEVGVPVTVCGDVHGQFYDLIKL